MKIILLSTQGAGLAMTMFSSSLNAFLFNRRKHIQTHGLILWTQDPNSGAQKLTIFPSHCSAILFNWWELGPFVDYNLMIAFSESAVNGGVSYIFSPPRAAIFLPKPISGLQISPIFSFSCNFICVSPSTAVKFCPKLWNPISRVQGFSNAQRVANVTVGFQIKPPLSSRHNQR